MASHPIERKLRIEICPYIVTSKHLRKWPPYFIYMAYSYVGEVFVLLAGFGFANPIMSFLTAGQAVAAKEAVEQEPTIVKFLSGSDIGWISLILLLIWGLLKFYIKTEDLEKRCSLLKSYIQQCAQFEFRLIRALALEEPMDEVIKIHTKLMDLVDRNIAERSLLDTGIDSKFDDETKQYCDRLIAKYSDNWKQPPINDRNNNLRGDNT